jgi:hypothetical protein
MAGIALSESSDEEPDGLPSFLSLSTIQSTVLGVILAQAAQLELGESQRRENSIFPSASVGTPLHVAGR